MYKCEDWLTWDRVLGGMEGHVSRDCTQEQKAKSCYRCGQEGHISRDCPDSASASTAFGSSSGGGASSGTECYRCGKVGHIARSCPEAPGGGSSRGGGNFAAFGGNSGKTWYVASSAKLCMDR